jgi:soluble lytic murein transglycosylase
MILGVGLLVLTPMGCGKDEVTLDDVRECLAMERQGRGISAIDQLARIAPLALDPVRLDLELALGNMLVKYRRPEQAVPHLEVALEYESSLKPYAQLLLARALFQMGEKPEKIRSLAAEASRVDTVGLLVDVAGYLMVEADRMEGDYEAVVRSAGAYIEARPEGKWADDVRWLLANAYERIGSPAEGHVVCEDIWYETPSSPHALEALNMMTDLRDRFGYRKRVLSGDEQYDFVKALRAAGRHREALDEISKFLRAFPSHPRAADALFLEAGSSYEVRENKRCLNAVLVLRHSYPNSKWIPNAMIYAIRSLRRDDNTAEVRRWCNLLISEYPNHTKGYEGLYNLATYMANIGLWTDDSSLVEESREAFARLIRDGGTRDIVKDAFWKYAWFQIRNGERRASVATMEELLERFPDTGYRPAALFWIGKLRLEAGDRAGAAASWQAAVEETPFCYYGHRSREMLAVINTSARRTGGQKVFPPIDTLDKPIGRVRYDMAVRLKQVGLYGFAANQLEIEMGDVDDPGLRFALAELRSSAGQGAKALAEIREEFREFTVSGGRDIPDAFWRVVYPLHHWPVIQEESENHGFDPWLVVALIRRESLFDANATSRVGAVGLMQIMPDTAPLIAKELGLPAPTQSDLYDPILNIRYGVQYLYSRVQEFEGDFTAAVCSYNAGVGPVRRWLETIEVEDLDEWIELIPYKDTRLYIKNVLGDLREYRRIYG